MRILLVALLLAAMRPSSSLPAIGVATAQNIVSDDGAHRVDDYLTRLVPHGFSGAVLIAKDGQVVLRKGYGLANRRTKVPYAADMVSPIGSITKQFTGAAIVKLEMQGKLKTSDPISKYLPGVPADKSSITIHHLLTHTAGFPGDLGGGDAEPIGRDALVARVLAVPLASKPGGRFEYSNEGYSLAGAIVERVSGQGYEAYLREHLFRPAGMNDTGYLMPDWSLERLPIGYRLDGGEWGRIYKRGWLSDGPGWYLRANGGIHSTLDDMYRWHVALESNTVLSQAAAAKYQTGHVASFGGERYAYGWGVQHTRRGTPVITHNGGNGIFFADVRRYVRERVVIIAMSNQPVVPATQLAPRQLEPLFFGDATVPMPPAGVDVPRAHRDALAGTYTLDNGGQLIVRAIDAGLEAESSDPLLFSEAQVTPPGGRFADLESRSIGVLQNAANGNLRPLFEAFNDDRPFEVVEGNQKKIWTDWRAKYGDFVKAESLGTTSAQGDPAVIVRLHFAKGGPVLQLVWGPRRLLGWRQLEGVGAVRLLAESAETWVFYRYLLTEPVRLTFGTDGSVEIARGAVRIRGTK